ncbi:uncharacterized protein LOC111704691 isoform X1 [Eurytemora carolleeae]|uniref:uncharacterized protein LOC111704691 isoform X1 n=1 Tax=Eurytemora carolleeae TaxID=1294199 RepID=UPI000C77E880|nr:uncharacterized protein LOC111704691 isoform X1 [Eurytemora carolleeae]|eukprot:XP_023332772.1 uncharacterized protein LOC111704691 isoform X1 [Eurytemora affinis]
MAASPISQLANWNDDKGTSREGLHNFPDKLEGWQNSREDAYLEAAGLTTNQIQTFAFDYNKMSGFLFPQNTDQKKTKKQGKQPKITEQIDSQIKENISMNPNMEFGGSENEKMYIESEDENNPDDLERRLSNQEEVYLVICYKVEISSELWREIYHHLMHRCTIYLQS